MFSKPDGVQCADLEFRPPDVPDLDERLIRGARDIQQRLVTSPLVARQIYLEDYIEEVPPPRSDLGMDINSALMLCTLHRWYFISWERRACLGFMPAAAPTKTRLAEEK